MGTGLNYSYTQHFGDHVYRIESDGRTAWALVDGKLICAQHCGIRIITDRKGNILRQADIE